MMESKFRAFLRELSMVPVLTIQNVDDAEPLSAALHQAGINIFEITLRTCAAVPSIQRIKSKYPDALVGVGTILNVSQYEEVLARTSVDFAVSPGSSENLLIKASQMPDIPFLFGVATATEVMHVRDYGFDLLKFFPSHGTKGTNTLNSWAPVFPDIQFFPTCGINLTNAINLLQLPNVSGVGGNWMAPDELIQRKDWEGIYQIAKESVDTLKSLKDGLEVYEYSLN